MNHYLGTGEAGWRALPLCCSYLVVIIDLLSLKVGEECIVRDQTVCWALGVLADGQHEVCGVWPHPASNTTGWHDLFESLKVRGVEKVQFVASSEPVDVSAAMRVAYPATTVLPAIRQLLRQSLTQAAPRHRSPGAQALEGLCAAATAQAAGALLTELEASPWGESNPAVVEQWRIAVEQLEPFYALVPRLRRRVLAGYQAAEQVGRTLQRPAARQGCFPTETAAVAFVSQVLDRVNRDFGAADFVAMVHGGTPSVEVETCMPSGSHLPSGASTLGVACGAAQGGQGSDVRRSARRVSPLPSAKSSHFNLDGRLNDLAAIRSQGSASTGAQSMRVGLNR